jgi:hypothetical protein
MYNVEALDSENTEQVRDEPQIADRISESI